jgi:hypothetical protein
MITIGRAVAELLPQLRAGRSGDRVVRSWTGTAVVASVPVRYDCRAVDAAEAPQVIAAAAGCDTDQVTDVARVCPIFGPVEVGDPR